MEEFEERNGVSEVSGVEEESFIRVCGVFGEVVDADPRDVAGSTDDAVHFVAFFQKKFGEVRAVLTGDAGDKGDTRDGVGQESLSSSEATMRSIICSKGTEFSQPRRRRALEGLP